MPTKCLTSPRTRREQHNLLFDANEAKQPAVAAKFAELKAEMARLQQEYKRRRPIRRPRHLAQG